MLLFDLLYPIHHIPVTITVRRSEKDGGCALYHNDFRLTLDWLVRALVTSCVVELSVAVSREREFFTDGVNYKYQVVMQNFGGKQGALWSQ